MNADRKGAPRGRQPMRPAACAALLLLGALAWCTPAAAAGGKAEAAFEAGVTAFRAGDFRAARDRFLEARRRGMDHPNLDLNLGLSHYRLGDHESARPCFERIRNDLRYTAVADYHLGLMAAERGERDAAMRSLQTVHALTASTLLRDQASAALRRLDDMPLDESPWTPDVPEPDGLYYLRTATGFDSNPELVSEALDRPVTDEGTGYAEVAGNLEHPLGQSGWGTTLFRADLRLRQHDGEAGYDHQSGDLGLRQAWRLGAWRLGVGGEGGAAWLDGEAYQGTGALLLDGRRRVGPDVSLTMRYEARVVGGEGQYAYLDGWRQRFETDVARSFGALRGRLEAEYEHNQRADLTVGEEFSSYSPDRATLAVALGSPALRRVSTELRARYRYSRYGDPNRFLEGDELRTGRREDRLAALALRMRLRSGPTWNWLAEYGYSRNDSSLAAYEYARHVATVGIEWLR